jgi:RNA polymerase sigma factor (sigma-70 family)
LIHRNLYRMDLIDESELLFEFHNGSHAAFERIYHEFHTTVFLWAIKYNQSEENAKDIRSKCFIKLWDQRDKLEFKSMHAIAGWLRHVVFNSCVDETRRTIIRERKSNEIISRFVQYYDDDVFEVSDKEAIILNRLLKRIDSLPVKFKTVFNMRVLEELKFKEISQKLNIDLSLAKKRYARALFLIRKPVEDNHS